MKLVRIKAEKMPWDGLEIEVEEDATEDEIRQTCWDSIGKYLDFKWEIETPTDVRAGE